MNLQQTVERKSKYGFFLGNFTKSTLLRLINFFPTRVIMNFNLHLYLDILNIFLISSSSNKQCQVAVEYPVSLYSDITTLFPFSLKYSAVHHSKYFCVDYFHIKTVQTLLHYIPILLLHFHFF